MYSINAIYSSVCHQKIQPNVFYYYYSNGNVLNCKELITRESTRVLLATACPYIFFIM